jgi:hypothetical protein
VTETVVFARVPVPIRMEHHRPAVRATAEPRGELDWPL